MNEVPLYVFQVRSAAAVLEDAIKTAIHSASGNHFTEMCSGSEEGSYRRLIDSCITQLKAQGPSRTCNESQEEAVRVAPYRGTSLIRNRAPLQGYLAHKKPRAPTGVPRS